MKHIVYIALCFALLQPGIVSAQACVPGFYEFNSYGDYTIHRSTVLKCMKWLVKKPLHRNVQLRSEVEGYCMKWLCGHPHLKIELLTKQVPYLDRNPQLLYVYLSKWVLLSLEEPDLPVMEKHLRATKAVLKLAAKSKGLVEDETLIKLIHNWRSGDLPEWAAQSLTMG